MYYRPDPGQVIYTKEHPQNRYHETSKLCKPIKTQTLEPKVEQAKTTDTLIYPRDSLQRNKRMVIQYHASAHHRRESVKPEIYIQCLTSSDQCTAEVSFCQVAGCEPDREKQHEWSDKYLCVTVNHCLGGKTKGFSKYMPYGCECGNWNKVIANTGTKDWGYNPRPELKGRISILKNPGGKVIINLLQPKKSDSGIFVLGENANGYLQGLIEIDVTDAPPTPLPLGEIEGTQDIQANVRYLTNLTLKDKIALETGYVEKNEWLEWMQYTAKQNERSNCIACSTARPTLGTSPFRLSNQDDPTGLQCVLQLFHKDSVLVTEQCKSLSLLFPAVQQKDRPPSAVVYKGNYTCFSRTGSGRSVGTLGQQYCQETIDVTKENGNYSAMRSKLPSRWAGECALTQLLVPFHIFPVQALQDLHVHLSPDKLKRSKRSVPSGSFDDRVYIDAIGVPRGVPNEFKARNQVGAGFESFLAWWVTINKNVDWINYIYYNQQRFVNFTRDAVRGIAEQLGPTSLMAWQNRMALDMLLAEKGGVCKMFGTYCCVFIPNNTSPDGSITKALEGLTTLSEELAENSGISDPFSDLLEQWFGKWSGLIVSFLISLVVAGAVLTLCGCCCIPCIRGLLQRLIDATLTKTLYQQAQEDDDESEYVELNRIV
uniref:Uncharacterized protein n=2 Tax=Astyanax mexicanus TaxID=7994 RepID=A0A3B1IU47_ASTMX